MRSFEVKKIVLGVVDLLYKEAMLFLAVLHNQLREVDLMMSCLRTLKCVTLKVADHRSGMKFVLFGRF